MRRASVRIGEILKGDKIIYFLCKPWWMKTFRKLYWKYNKKTVLYENGIYICNYLWGLYRFMDDFGIYRYFPSEMPAKLVKTWFELNYLGPPLKDNG